MTSPDFCHGLLRLGRIGVIFFKWAYVRLVLQVFGVNTSRRCEEIPLRTVHTNGFDSMEIDKSIVSENPCVVGRNVTHSSHVSSQRIDVLDSSCGPTTITPVSKVKEFKLVGIRLTEFRIFQIDAADPISLLLQENDQVMANKATGAGDKDPCR